MGRADTACEKGTLCTVRSVEGRGGNSNGRDLAPGEYLFQIATWIAKETKSWAPTKIWQTTVAKKAAPATRTAELAATQKNALQQ